jgi:hypothetical protein
MVERMHRRGLRFSRRAWRLIAIAASFLIVVCGLLLARRADGAPQSATAGANHHIAANHQDADAKTAFEPGDWPITPVALIYVGALILLVISILLMIVAYPNSLPDVGRTLRITPPGPRLQTDSEGDLREFRAAEEKKLNTYYWIDKQKGVVHVPIEQAMHNLAKSGVPGFPKAQQ